MKRFIAIATAAMLLFSFQANAQKTNKNKNNRQNVMGLISTRGPTYFYHMTIIRPMRTQYANSLGLQSVKCRI